MLEPGAMLQSGKYRVENILGYGGFGVTYRARHILANRGVVLKEYFPRQIAHRDSRTNALVVTEDEERQRAFSYGLKAFLREGQILFGIKHPHIVSVLDIFQENATAYLVMDYLEGPNLFQAMRSQNGKLPEPTVKAVGDALVAALSEVHRIGFCHLDLKPANVMCLSDGRFVLIDFGAAKQGTSLATESYFAFTQSYAPRELFLREGFGPESDIFQVGVLLYQLLTGKLPPDALVRLGGKQWTPEGLKDPWHKKIEAATRMERAERPKNIQAWWEGREAVTAAADAGLTVPITSMPGLFTGTDTPSKNGPVSQGDVTEMDAPPTTPQVKINPEDGAEMVLVPAGTFLRGSSDPTADADEMPRRALWLDGFWMYRDPVTVAQFETFCKDTGRTMPEPPSFNPDWEYTDHPMVNVTWEEAQAYCRWAGGRLPTEAQWEKAARGVDGRTYPWGEILDESLLWSPLGTRRSGTGAVTRGDYNNQSPFGIYDLVGNVWEWCLDWYVEDYYRSSVARNPGGPISGIERCLRGGSWDTEYAWVFRVTYRGKAVPTGRYRDTGFRVAVAE